MRKVFRALIISLLVIALVATTIYALTTFFTVPWDMTVVIAPPVKSVAVFSDNLCTQPVVALHWGQVSTGQSLTFDFYLKNTGNAAVVAGMSIPEDMTNILVNVSFSPAQVSLAAGQVGKITFSASVSSNATAGVKSGTFVASGD
jgi:hypothetical protein